MPWAFAIDSASIKILHHPQLPAGNFPLFKLKWTTIPVSLRLSSNTLRYPQDSVKGGPTRWNREKNSDCWGPRFPSVPSAVHWLFFQVTCPPLSGPASSNLTTTREHLSILFCRTSWKRWSLVTLVCSRRNQRLLKSSQFCLLVERSQVSPGRPVLLGAEDMCLMHLFPVGGVSGQNLPWH